MSWLHQNKIQTIFFLLIVVLASIPALLALFHPGFFQTDDGEWMIIRFSAFHQALRDGEFPVRFLGRLNFGYGYPVADFLYPGFMYLAELPKLLGFGFVNSIKIILGASLLGSGIFFYLWLSKLFDRYSSVVGALFYVFTPYHLYDVYTRGSVGEVLALAVVPFILWQIERKSFFWTTLGIGFLILSHNTLAVLFFPLIVLYFGLDIFISQQKSSLFYRYLVTLVAGVGLASFFFLPALFDLQYTVFSKTTVSNFNSYFALINLIGLPVLLVFLVSAVLVVIGKIELSKHRLSVLLFAIGMVSLFFSSSLSGPVWNVLPVSFIQFPFRLLSVTILCASFLSACCVSVFTKQARVTSGVVLLLVAFFSSLPFVTPSQLFDKGEGFYATNEATTTVQNEYMPRWVKDAPQTHFNKKSEFLSGAGSISALLSTNRSVEFSVHALSDSKVFINTIYFPGWDVFVDGQKTAVNYSNPRGVMEISIPKGEHRVISEFSETPFRTVADGISLLCLFLTLGITFIFKNRFFGSG